MIEPSTEDMEVDDLTEASTEEVTGGGWQDLRADKVEGYLFYPR